MLTVIDMCVWVGSAEKTWVRLAKFMARVWAGRGAYIYEAHFSKEITRI
jgi:hypothetical protein